MLMSFVGPLLPAWGCHLQSDFFVPSLLFLSLALGILASGGVARKLLPGRGIAFMLQVASALGCLSLLYLSVVSPPFSYWWRIPGVFLLGGSSGLLIRGLFHAVAPSYRHDPAATINIAGLLFVLGGFVLALLVSGAFYVYTVSSILVLLALIPGLFAVMFLRSRFPPITQPQGKVPWKQTLRDFQSPGTVLLALLVLFQSGNEWSIAGWLTIFLIRRIGISPALSLLLLALYWLALLLGRALTQFFLPRVSHTRLLATSIAAALFGCIILSFTQNSFGAISGVLFVGGGFAAVYPLVIERIDHRHQYPYPVFLEGIFLLATVGGLLAPWTLGFFADWWGIGALMLLPLAGTLMVFLLLALIGLEAKLSGRKAPT